jgi:hypothetical protein
MMLLDVYYSGIVQFVQLPFQKYIEILTRMIRVQPTSVQSLKSHYKH